jgi:DNA (cytosine-5)-methyltransferase 1
MTQAASSSSTTGVTPPLRKRSPVAVSVFSGSMGLDLGLEAAGFQVRFAADIDGAAVETARANRPNLPYYERDVRLLSGKEIGKLAGLKEADIDLLAGGPPCQSFSTAGRRLALDDEDKGPLVFEFVRLLAELKPRAFLMENVRGILSASQRWRELPYNNNGKCVDEHHGSLLREIVRRVRALGYSLDYRILNAADYGVPQIRERVFFIGLRDGQVAAFPEATHAKDGGLFHQPWRTLGDALVGLRDDTSPRTSFSARKLRYLRLVPPGGNWRDLPVKLQQESMGRAFHALGGRCGYWRRLSFDAPSPTVLTEPQNASTSLCHPVEDRPLTVRECARLQTFPDDWTFVGRTLEQYRLVGNAVPIQLATCVADSIKRMLRK